MERGLVQLRRDRGEHVRADVAHRLDHVPQGELLGEEPRQTRVVEFIGEEQIIVVVFPLGAFLLGLALGDLERGLVGVRF